MKIALVGDYDASVMAHRAIPRAIGIAARAGNPGRDDLAA